MARAVYVLVSHRLFELTNALKTAFVPHSNNGVLLRNGLLMAALGALAYATGAFALSMQLFPRGSGVAV